MSKVDLNNGKILNEIRKGLSSVANERDAFQQLIDRMDDVGKPALRYQ